MKRKQIFTLLAALPILLCFYLVNRYIAGIERLMLEGMNILRAIDGVWLLIIKHPLWLSTDPMHLGVSAFSVIIILMMSNLRLGRRFRDNEEYGSARWGTKKDINPYVNPIADENIILTKTESLTMASRAKCPVNARNKNILVIGGPGSGKTRFYVKPNLMQLHSSYVITDPKGTLLRECGKLLADNGYIIKVLNVNGARGMRQSQRYNPFAYITCEADILMLVDTLITNTTGEGKESKEPFWEQAEKLLYSALISYILETTEPEEQNINTLVRLITECSARDNDEEYQSPIDLLFEELEKESPTCFAVRQYKKFKNSPGKTAQNILITCGARFAPFEISEVRELIGDDELELGRLGEVKTALFVITSDTNKTFNFIAAIMYSQMFNLLCDKAAFDYDGSLPVHVRFLLDEFANIGKIPNFDQIISVLRSREMSVNVILQSKAQLDSVYDKKADIIVDCCDTMLFLGSKSTKTLDEISKILGKETIGKFDEGTSRGRDRSDSTTYQKLGRELLTADELAVLDGNKCICLLRGVYPFLSDKYDIMKHKRYKWLSDADRANEYTPDWVKLSAPPEPDEEYYCWEVDEQSA